MAHDNCMYGGLTRAEQARAADWLVRTMRARPDDFVFLDIPGLIIDQRSSITITMIDGTDYVYIDAYKMTAPPLGLIEGEYARAVKDAAHRLRHRNGNPASKTLDTVMAAHPTQGAPAIPVPLDEYFAAYSRLEETTPWIGSEPASDEFARTEPEVTKLRSLVASAVKDPIGALAILFLIATLSATVLEGWIAFVGKALAG